ncbi:8-amino-7-oxononanoate synthase [Sinobacterium caligoides]|uniref:8-amino-7-oxononanoate synthase n=1 Tax=Sinobacterium caligoides TaxID=933926 RepID=A0A3N2DQ69_9GAMM|nr:8-amino-7-oxononanoate synthase [Sinobacterium caligoides]ROS01933.1 8-amino-7-oxononanoate synthase [Sinobacterium caligoides]
MVASFERALAAGLQQRAEQQLYRRRLTVTSAPGAEVDVDGRRCINFCSNDYLGHASHPKLAEAATLAAKRFGVGSGASHLVCGHSSEHHALEEELAALTGRPRALLFSTGYMANLGAISALLTKGDFVFEDKLNHASLIDGGLLSGARFQRFLHNDVAALERRLARSDDEGRKLVAVDGVFSMDGDIAPLTELTELCARHDACLMVDDAHGLGVLGERGGGCAEHFELNTAQLPILMGGLGKGLGSSGAFIAGSEALIETLVQFARSYIYTTAMPPMVAAASRASIALLASEAWRRQHLNSMIERFRHGAEQLGLPLMASSTPIQPLLIGDAGRAMAYSGALMERGIWVGAIRPPTVAAGSARLRITLSASHSTEQVDRLLSVLADVSLLDRRGGLSYD